MLVDLLRARPFGDRFLLVLLSQDVFVTLELSDLLTKLCNFFVCCLPCFECLFHVFTQLLLVFNILLNGEIVFTDDYELHFDITFLIEYFLQTSLELLNGLQGVFRFHLSLYHLSLTWQPIRILIKLSIL